MAERPPEKPGEHPTDEELLRLVEATVEAAPALGAHLAGCAPCRARVSAARAAARALARSAPQARAFCPPRQVLAAREEGALTGAERARLDAHAAACPACRAELGDLRALFAPEPAPAPAGLATLRLRAVLLLDAARRGLELLESTLLPAPAPALIPVRGGEGEAQGTRAAAALAPFGAGALSLTWAPTAGGGERGGPAAADLLARSQGAAPRAYRLELGPADEPGVWESHTADAEGAVRIAGLAPGRYQVRAYVPQEAAPALVLALEVRAG